MTELETTLFLLYATVVGTALITWTFRSTADVLKAND